MIFDFWFILAFWQQFLLVSLVFAAINFLGSFFLEAGPLASSSPLSGGGGFIATGIVDLIAFIAGLTLSPLDAMNNWIFLCAPSCGWWIMLGCILIAGIGYQSLQRAMMRRFGLENA